MRSNKAFELGFGKTKHEIETEQLTVKGKIPDWLQGTLIRNGPGTFSVAEEHYRHWFDGLAMLHKFTIANGQVLYSNKYLDTHSYREAQNEGKIVYSEFATDPSRTIFEKVKYVFKPKITDSAKVNVAKIGQNFMALAETPIQVLFNPKTLETVGHFSYEDRLVGQMTTVHPQFEVQQNLTYNLVTHFDSISHYHFYELKNGKHAKKVAVIPVSKPAYMHSFGMTKNYFILTEFPLIVNPIALLLWLKPYIENYHWRPGRGTRITLIDRQTGKIKKRFLTDPFFAFHHINAFETEQELIFDIAAYHDSSILQAYYLDRLKEENNKIPFGNLRRYFVPFKGGKVRYETLSDVCMELPNFDIGRYNTSGEYRFIYASSINPKIPSGFYNQIVKVDILGKKNATWYQDGNYPGETIFVGRPGRTQEDDGVLLSVILDEKNNTSYLLILDASSLEEVARAGIPNNILFGYHGAFFPYSLT